MKTDDEIYHICERIWVRKNTWDLTYLDLCALTWKGNDKNKGETVYIRPKDKSEMSRHMAEKWIEDWKSFSHGFITAYRLLEKE